MIIQKFNFTRDIDLLHDRPFGRLEMGAAGSVPKSIEEAKAQGFSEEDINKYIAEQKDKSTPSAESDQKVDEDTEKSTADIENDAPTSSDAPAHQVGAIVEVLGDFGLWDEAKVTDIKDGDKYTLFFHAGYHLGNTVEDIPVDSIRATACEPEQPLDENGLRIGSDIKVWQGFGSTAWEPAIVTNIQDEGTYEVECTRGYYLGDIEEGVSNDRIRPGDDANPRPDYTKMSVPKLREMLRARGAEAARLGFPNKELYKTKGRKLQLVERLREVDRVDDERAALAPVSEVEKRRREEEARLSAARSAREAKLKKANFPVLEALIKAAQIAVPALSELERVTHAIDDGTDPVSFHTDSEDEGSDEDSEEANEAKDDDEGKAESEGGEGKEADKEDGASKADPVGEAKESKGEEAPAKETKEASGVRKRINWKFVAKDLQLAYSCLVNKKLPYLDLSMKRIEGDVMASILAESEPALHTIK